MSVEVPAHLRDRYGVRRTPLYLLAGIAVVVLAAVAVLVVLGNQILNPGVTSRLLAWKVESPTAVTVTWEISRAPGSTVVCVVRAQDRTKVDVGYATVPVAPGETYKQPRMTLRTNATAFTVELLGCGVDAVPADVTPPQFPPGVVPPAQIPPALAPAIPAR